jgi:hypothetical protein
LTIGLIPQGIGAGCRIRGREISGGGSKGKEASDKSGRSPQYGILRYQFTIINSPQGPTHWSNMVTGDIVCLVVYLEEHMGTKVKPIQPTELKDKKIAREVIEQIRKPISASVYRRHEKLAEQIDKMIRT